MPSLNQINEKTIPYSNKTKHSGKWNMALYAVMILILVGMGCIWYYMQINIYSIPEHVYATKNDSVFKELFISRKKKIIWFSGDNAEGQQLNNNIIYPLRYEKLLAYYEPHIYSKDTFQTSCRTSQCLDGYIAGLCSTGVCIIVPSSKKIIKTDLKKMFDDLHRYKNF